MPDRVEGRPGIEYEPTTGGSRDHLRSAAHAVGDEPALRGVRASGLPTFGDVYDERMRTTRPLRRLIALLVAAVASGPFAVLGALLSPGGTLSPLFLVAVIVPAVEELLKAAGALHLAEQRPWLVPRWWTLPLVTLTAGLVFAVIENGAYLWVYIEDPTPEIVRWRWIAGPLVHGISSLVAGIGVGRMWLRTTRTRTPAPMRTALPWLVGAVVLHGGYNAIVTLLELTGRIF